jgi:TonB-linked SusC/RagA family outer membrane protein
MKKREQFEGRLFTKLPFMKILMIMKVIIVLVCFTGILDSAAQQGKNVNGKVNDSSGASLPGVSVVVKGTTIGVITDNGGTFSISNIPESATLQFSFVGMKTQEIVVGKKTIINVTLADETIGIEEVVAIGYGTRKKETLSGAIASIKSKDILSTKSTSVVSSLQGKIAGVQVRQQTAEPGTFNSMVSIRGFGSPLVVIDGVARDGMSDFERLNPEDIESVSVLKDASAAIYGMNADNGVLIVTTKKGSTGKTKFTYNSFFGTKAPTSMLKSVDAYTYRTMKNEMQRNTGLAPTFSDDVLAKWKTGTEPGYQDYNWIDNTLKNFTTQQQHNLSVSGGNEIITFYSSLGYMEDNGLLKSNIQKYQKYNFRNNMTVKLTNDLKATISFSGKIDNNTSPQGSYFWLFKPIIIADRGYSPFVPSNPSHIARIPPEFTNPYALATESVSGYDKWTNLQYQSSVELTYDVPFVKGLKLGVLGAYDGNVNNASNLQLGYYTYDYTTDAPTAPRANIYNNSNSLFSRRDFQAQISYQNTFNKVHNFGATVVYEAKAIRNDYLRAQRQYDDLFTHDIIDQGSLTNQQTGGNRSSQAFLSLLGRFNYDYKSKYLIEFAFRDDGSYRYAPSKRWAFFPSVSGGWRVSEEPFFKDNLKFVSNFKIRGSYGMMGADAGNAFEYYEGYKFGGINGGYVMNNGVLTMGMVPPGVVNENLTWVKTRTANVGVDIDLWNGKLGITSDIFQKNRDGLLGNRVQSVPNTFGASFPQENVNSDLVRGIELMISHKGKIGDFNYNVSANATYSRKYLIHTERAPYQSTMQMWKDVWGNDRYQGREWGYSYSGQYTDIAQYQTAPLLGGTNGNSKNLPGSYRITDVNGDGVIDGNDQLPTFWSGQYQGYAGNPPLQYGLTFNCDWKGLDFNMLLQGASLYTIYTAPNDVWGYGNYPNLWEKYLDRWHTVVPNADPYDPSTKWVSAEFPALRSNFTGTTDNLITDRWRLNATYLRIKSVEIGYTIPKVFTRKIRIDNLRVYLNCFNLLTFTNKNAKGMDPEREEGAYTADLTYPLMRSYNLGININF